MGLQESGHPRDVMADIMGNTGVYYGLWPEIFSLNMNTFLKFILFYFFSHAAQHVGFNSLTRDPIHTPCIGSTDS